MEPDETLESRLEDAERELRTARKLLEVSDANLTDWQDCALNAERERDAATARAEKAEGERDVARKLLKLSEANLTDWENWHRTEHIEALRKALDEAQAAAQAARHDAKCWEERAERAEAERALAEKECMEARAEAAQWEAGGVRESDKVAAFMSAWRTYDESEGLEELRRAKATLDALCTNPRSETTRMLAAVEVAEAGAAELDYIEKDGGYIDPDDTKWQELDKRGKAALARFRELSEGGE